MKRIVWSASTMAAFLLAACAHQPGVGAQGAGRAGRTNDDAAELPRGNYKSFCLYLLDTDRHPLNPRAAILDIKASLTEGWPTAKEVVLKPPSAGEDPPLPATSASDEHKGACKPYGLVQDGDKMMIKGSNGNFRLEYSSLKSGRSGKNSDDFAMTPFDLKAGTTIDGKPLWYHTSEDHPGGVQYFIYMLDENGDEDDIKIQRYLIEAFVTRTMNGRDRDEKCLRERPVYLSNVFPVAKALDCSGDRPLQNGLGTGEEPK